MAIFYDHVKGYYNNYYYWIDWNGSAASPEIKYSDSNDKDDSKSLGSIITSGASNQSITKDFTFTGKVYFDTSSYYIYANPEQGVLHVGTGDEILQLESHQGSYIQVTTDKITNSISTNIQQGLYVGLQPSNYLYQTGVIQAQYQCMALYFNATSDRRAKENITPTNFSALGVINSLPIYTFNYKSNPDQKVLGLIAQDAATHDLDGFNMVDNLNATGEGSDMMQMKESKLVYVLWRAVQELSEEVENLKAEIASLK